MLLSEQNIHFAELVSDRVYVLEKGQVRWQGRMAELAGDGAARAAAVDVIAHSWPGSFPRALGFRTSLADPLSGTTVTRQLKRLPLQNLPQPLRRHRQLRDRAGDADGVVDRGGDRGADRVDAAFARALEAERIERARRILGDQDVERAAPRARSASGSRRN